MSFKDPKIIFHEALAASEVARVTRVRPESIQNWLKRDLIVGHRKISGGGSQGRHRHFSFHNVMEIAIAKALVDVGLNAKRAFASAADFAHVGGGGAIFELPERNPGCPFHFRHGHTIFGIGNMRTFEEILAKDRDTYGRLSRHTGGIGLVSVDASKIFDLVVARMGYDPNEVLDWVYPKDSRASEKANSGGDANG